MNLEKETLERRLEAINNALDLLQEYRELTIAEIHRRFEPDA